MPEKATSFTCIPGFFPLPTVLMLLHIYIKRPQIVKWCKKTFNKVEWTSHTHAFTIHTQNKVTYSNCDCISRDKVEWTRIQYFFSLKNWILINLNGFYEICLPSRHTSSLFDNNRMDPINRWLERQIGLLSE